MPATSVLLAIETATAACSVALLAHGQVHERSEVGSNIHSRVLLTMVAELFQQAAVGPRDLDAVAVGQGPGSFTGLRIGVGVAQGLAYGVGCAMIGVSSLDVLAAQAPHDGSVIAAIDARMGEIYWCEYQKAGNCVNRQTELQVSAPAAIAITNPRGCALVGNAWAEYWDLLDPALRESANHLEDIVFPEASTLLKLAAVRHSLGEGISPGEFAPEYVRNRVAKKSSALKTPPVSSERVK